MVPRESDAGIGYRLPDKLLLTTQDVAPLLSMTQRGVTLQCAKGQLPAKKIANTWYINRAKLVEMLGLEE